MNAVDASVLPVSGTERPGRNSNRAESAPETSRHHDLVMLVDDEPTTVEVVRAYLEEAGYHRFVTTSEPRRALPLMRESEPDILLLDLMMPELSGFDILTRMAAEPGLSHIPAIVLTSSSDISNKLRALGLGASDFLAKPVDPTELALRLRNHLAVRAYERQLEQEQRRAEQLIASVLPVPIAARLKRGERSIAESFDSVSVLFADIVEFTRFASNENAQSVLELLNYVFELFDDIVAQTGLEKVKTIGDAYMLAGGVPSPRSDHVEAVVDCGLAMLEAIENFGGHPDWNLRLRVGVHTGPVVAGVLGSRRLCYDLWGDTVNVAARMQSLALPGTLLATETVAQALGPRFVASHRGELQVKGRGTMETFFVSRATAPTLPAARRSR